MSIDERIIERRLVKGGIAAAWALPAWVTLMADIATQHSPGIADAVFVIAGAVPVTVLGGVILYFLRDRT